MCSSGSAFVAKSKTFCLPFRWALRPLTRLQSAHVRADSIETMAVALRWYVTTSGLWALATIWFIVTYTSVGRIGRVLAVLISSALIVAMLLNFSSPASFLYTELTGLRQISLPWGEQLWLRRGR